MTARQCASNERYRLPVISEKTISLLELLSPFWQSPRRRCLLFLDSARPAFSTNLRALEPNGPVSRTASHVRSRRDTWRTRARALEPDTHPRTRPPVESHRFPKRATRGTMTATNDEWRGLEKTYAMIKPDAVAAGKVDDILKIAEDAGFVVVRRQEQRMDAVRAGEFYAEHKGEALLRQPRGVHVQRADRGVLPREAQRDQGLARPDGTHEHVHREGGRAQVPARQVRHRRHAQRDARIDSPASAMRELKFFFPNLRLDPIPEGAAARSTSRGSSSPRSCRRSPRWPRRNRPRTSSRRSSGSPIGSAPTTPTHRRPTRRRNSR